MSSSLATTRVSEGKKKINRQNGQPAHPPPVKRAVHKVARHLRVAVKADPARLTTTTSSSLPDRSSLAPSCAC